MAPYPVRCPANKALTRFGWNGGGKITFTCCPKPAPGMTESVTSASNTQAAAATAAAAAPSCRRKLTMDCRGTPCDLAEAACNAAPCCELRAAA